MLMPTIDDFTISEALAWREWFDATRLKLAAVARKAPPPACFTPEQEAWLHDLETTDEPQTRGALHRLKAHNDRVVGWCCLGRYAFVMKRPGIECGDDSFLSKIDGSTVQLMNWKDFNLRGSSGELLEGVHGTSFEGVTGYWTTLAELNDELRWSFKEIAAFIRAKPWNVFTNFPKV